MPHVYLIYRERSLPSFTFHNRTAPLNKGRPEMVYFIPHRSVIDLATDINDIPRINIKSHEQIDKMAISGQLPAKGADP